MRCPIESLQITAVMSASRALMACHIAHGHPFRPFTSQGLWKLEAAPERSRKDREVVMKWRDSNRGAGDVREKQE